VVTLVSHESLMFLVAVALQNRAAAARNISFTFEQVGV
jgi:hypothetical protein